MGDFANELQKNPQTHPKTEIAGGLSISDLEAHYKCVHLLKGWTKMLFNILNLKF